MPHTPHFTVRVWGSPGQTDDWLAEVLHRPRPRVPIADIEIDSTNPGSLTVTNHRGLEIINQKMLTAAPDQPTLWHQS